MPGTCDLVCRLGIGLRGRGEGEEREVHIRRDGEVIG
jgi:hypothetical protein